MSQMLLNYIRSMVDESHYHSEGCDYCDTRHADIIRWLYYTCKQEGK
jgi:hypothetical protein